MGPGNRPHIPGMEHQMYPSLSDLAAQLPAHLRPKLFAAMAKVTAGHSKHIQHRLHAKYPRLFKLSDRRAAVRDALRDVRYQMWVNGQLEDYPGAPASTPEPVKPRSADGVRHDIRF